MKKAFLYSLLLHFLISALCVHAKSSGCEMCASTGNCYAAYKNSPGQFCGYFHDYGFETKPCCCPNDSYCNMSPFECLCHVPDRRYVPPTPNYNYNYNGEGLGSLILFMVLLCCCCMCCNASSGMPEQESGYIPVAVPATGDVPSYQSRTVRPSSDSGPFGGWGPALGGFALGQAFSGGGGHHHHHRHHGGGHNISGDTGGGFGFGGGSDIRGDSGDGGFGFGGGGFGFGGGGGHDIRGDS